MRTLHYPWQRARLAILPFVMMMTAGSGMFGCGEALPGTDMDSEQELSLPLAGQASTGRDAEPRQVLAGSSWKTVKPMTSVRRYHTATLLPSGKVLLVGGEAWPFYPTNVELYDPATNTWTPQASLNSGRHEHTETLLPNGTVLVTGGEKDRAILSHAERFSPGT